MAQFPRFFRDVVLWSNGGRPRAFMQTLFAMRRRIRRIRHRTYAIATPSRTTWRRPRMGWIARPPCSSS